MSFEIRLLPPAEKDWEWWEGNNPKTIRRIEDLLTDISEHPYSGIGKPETLKWGLSGKWSRRINQKDRLVYDVDEELQCVYIYSLRYHD
ncbi:MAG: Txe/YoeB family addiction module toxin [Bacteroidales bacterium]|nr:Txe/YoeB family addiction module toxin [Bacteroidales bacterium]